MPTTSVKRNVLTMSSPTAWLETFAERSEIPFALLADRVGRLLLSATGGEVLGPEHNLSALRPDTTDRNPAVEQVEMASRPRISRAPLSHPTVDRISAQADPTKRAYKHRKSAGSGPRSYWAKMTPEQRSAEMKRRMSVTRNKTNTAVA